MRRRSSRAAFRRGGGEARGARGAGRPVRAQGGERGARRWAHSAIRARLARTRPRGPSVAAHGTYAPLTACITPADALPAAVRVAPFVSTRISTVNLPDFGGRASVELAPAIYIFVHFTL